MQESSPSDKLCGFLRTVVKAIELPDGDRPSSVLEFGTPCHTFCDGTEIGFKTETGVLLAPIVLDSDRAGQGIASSSGSGSGGNSEGEGRIGASVSSSKRRKRQMKKEVVQLIHGLVMSKCLKVEARVVGKVVAGESGDGGDGEVRVVVLVDVYLPIAVWSGWQFPKSAAKAAELFPHLSCDWEKRSSILKGNKKCEKYVEGDIGNLLSLPECHVLGCEHHSKVGDSSKRKPCELHDVFKSIPSLGKEEKAIFSRIKPNSQASGSGIWDLTDDTLINILVLLRPLDLVCVSCTSRHLRFLSASIMPCIKLKLFPHQLAAVEWMLHRERNPRAYPHPLFMEFVTEDDFIFYINVVSGEIATGMAPKVCDFRGGLFCDEPGLGKTITALSLILKTQGTLADPPDGVQVIWCTHNNDKRWGYYECRGHNSNGRRMTSPSQRSFGQNDRRGQFSLEKLLPTGKVNTVTPAQKCQSFTTKCPGSVTPASSLAISQSTPPTYVAAGRRSLGRIRKNLIHDYEGSSSYLDEPPTKSRKRKHVSSISRTEGSLVRTPYRMPFNSKNQMKSVASDFQYNDTWIQCDACCKWRKVPDDSRTDASAAWFCSMNVDPLFQDCNVPEESWDDCQPITYLPGFCYKGSAGGLAENVSFFTSVLQEQYTLMDSQTKRALTWLARLSPDKLEEMETFGLVCPGLVSSEGTHGFHKLFKLFGLRKKVEKGISRWFYPQGIGDLVLDLPALRNALCEPLDVFRAYLSRATLIVVPSNLVDHWKTQILKHVKPGQLLVYVWTDQKKPLAHELAWDYDIVITTFNRLSIEWSPQKRSVLMQVHWLRVILDEGHTLGSSVNLTNKLQMAVSLTASSRWLLTGTPTPNTPNSQLSHLQPLLKFLHEEVYGQNQKLWEAGILKPFEADLTEGRVRLLQLLSRCMISARKADLRCIPPCIKKITYLNFTEGHAKSYNELVFTVRRNILLADWNDPSHVESLLNPKQWKFRSNTIRNVRLSCCVAGHINVTHSGHDVLETMDILAGNGLDPLSEEYGLIKYNLSCGGNCRRCNQWCRLPIITPCRHLLCLDCVALDNEKCSFPGCNNPYQMQPPEIRNRPENPNPKWPVPKDLIELQPSYKQDAWDPDWQSTSSSKVSYLVQRLKEIQATSLRPSILMNGGTDTERVEDLISSSHEKQKDFYQQTIVGLSSNSSHLPLDKVIIFSQFLEHINVIEQQLTFAGIKFAAMYSPMPTSSKMKSLGIFQQDPNCMALLMDGSAALGLDLSFVTYVFLMEPIWDRSMEEQVISRAHRMGATRSIHVETLAMHGTIEEQMLEFLQNSSECRKVLEEHNGKQEHPSTKAHRSLHELAESNYLAHLSTVQTYSTR